MRKLIYAIISVFGLILINSCGLTDNREAQVHDFLQQKVTSESQGALKLDNFKKLNGYDQNTNGIKTYILEWQGDISTQQEIWKSGNFLVGYWSDFGVMTKQPNSMDELAMASSSKHFSNGTKIRLGGNALLLKTEQGWRVRELNVKTVQVLSEGLSNNNTKNNSIANGNQEIENSLRNLESNYQGRTNLYNNIVKMEQVSSWANSLKPYCQTVVEARSQITSVNVDINDPKTVQVFQNAQIGLQSSFNRLLAVAEAYPDLKTTQAYKDFLAQIEGIENRINVAKQEYNNLCKKRGRLNLLLGSQ